MMSELVQLSFDKIMQTRSYTVVILSAMDKRFAIYTDPSIGRVLQLYLTGTEKPRPLTHDLMYSVLIGTGSATSSRSIPGQATALPLR